jgi:Tol biopolymer transport system component
MRITAIVLCSLSCVSCAAYADGPADRKPTDPLTVTSVSRAASSPLPVEAILTTTNIDWITRSNDGRKLAYTSTASGRQNLWIMNADGTGAHQLVMNDDRQIRARFTPNDGAVVYNQDRNGNEYYDIYEVPVDGGEPRNLTNTPDISETVSQFSPDGKLLAIGVKQKTAPSTNLGVMEWPSGSVRQLTHEANPKANWLPNAFSPDGRFLYATRSIGTDDSEIFRIDVATGASEQLLEHTGTQLVSASRISHDGRTLLVTSNANGGNNVALFDLATKKLRWITHTEWSARGVDFAPDGHSVFVVMNVDGRASIRFIDLKTMQESERGVPQGWNTPVGSLRTSCPMVPRC